MKKYKIKVNYNLTLDEMFKLGHYDWINDDITTKHFPIKDKGKIKVALELVHFDEASTTEAALAELDQRGLRPATMAELLAFGAKYPELQKQFPIVSLGSSWVVSGGSRGFPYLDGSDGRRLLRLHYGEDDWFDDCRFLALRKSA